ncbi:MAG: AzlD domain-containing protein [Actinomycetaceae bacterium]|nr:AzlD domain-containing protein [Actinomycetaceae bacterium]
MMNVDVFEALGVIGVAFLVTYALRGLPFVVLSRWRDTPVLRRLAVLMPVGVMVILVVFTMRDIDFTAASRWVPMVAGIAATALIHWWKQNTLVSMIVGVFVYWFVGLLTV